MFVDLPLVQLRDYVSQQVEPADFDEFWRRTLAETEAHDLDLRITPVDAGLRTLDVFDVSFSGFGGQDIKAWLRVPAASSGPMPCIVEFVGYGGGRGLPHDYLFWASCGFAHLRMDTRGQGSGWAVGHTPDLGGASGPRVPGMMTAGIEDPDGYYYRRLITDGVRAAHAAAQLPVVDESRIAVVGASQGGGLALAVAGLSPHVCALVSMVPFLCDFPRAITFTDQSPYYEITQYLSMHRGAEETVLRTLSYFDGVNFAKRGTAPAWFSTGLMDDVCPPSTVFGAYREYAGPKEIKVWPYNGHDGGGRDEDLLAMQYVSRLAAPTPM